MQICVTAAPVRLGWRLSDGGLGTMVGTMVGTKVGTTDQKH